jgi:hypothetical protein
MSTNVVFLDPILTSLRENRLVMERLVQWKGVQPGLIHSVTDCAVYAIALGLVSHPDIIAQLDKVHAGTGPVRLSDGPDGLVIDAGGRHAWIVAESVVDVAIDSFRRTGAARVAVINVTEPLLLGVIAAIAEKHGLSATATLEADGSTQLGIAPRKAADPMVLDQIRRQGLPAKRTEWFELFRLSSNALAEDTPVSRTHTGSYMVLPDGTIVGSKPSEVAEEDVTLLTKDRLEFRR